MLSFNSANSSREQKMKASLPKRPDPQRALAAFKFGVYSQYVGVDVLPEAMVGLHGDVPVHIHMLLLHLVQGIAHASLAANGIQQWSDSALSPWPSIKSNFEEEASDLCENLSLYADHAILRHSELRPLYEFRKSFGRLRELVAVFNAEVDFEILSHLVSVVFGEASTPLDDSKAKAAHGRMEAAAQLLNATKGNDQLREIWRGEIDAAKPYLKTIREEVDRKIRQKEKPPDIIASILDKLLPGLCTRVQGFMFERLAGADKWDDQNAWIYEQLKSAATAEQICDQINSIDKVEEPKRAHWRRLSPPGIRSAAEEYRIRHSLPELKKPRGRPPK